MPMLHEKEDGTYCVWNAFNGCKTWQIDGKGLRLLRRRGLKFAANAIRRNIWFSQELFFEFLSPGLIYRGWR